ncbi:MAG: hydroxyethylthiazole kinase [Thermodesulfobacteriota bacterium]|nr:hydroxyethylthiazole kinase [Thermodesulfobacteriota bacterium]
MKITCDSIFTDIQAIRDLSPLVHNITNYVVMNNTANALLALGASPVMAHAEPEVADMAGISGALVINIGTLSDNWIDAMFTAAEAAGKKGIPVVLDPVGAGATSYRTSTAKKLMQQCRPHIIRGNGSEIMALGSDIFSTRGVDSASTAEPALHAAGSLNSRYGSVVCISGEIDYIIQAENTIQIRNGHAMMPKVTGLGCTASALCGAFGAVNKNTATAAAHAMAVMGIAGEMAGRNATGPGSFQMHFLDALYRISEKDVRELFRNS